MLSSRAALGPAALVCRVVTPPWAELVISGYPLAAVSGGGGRWGRLDLGMYGVYVVVFGEPAAPFCFLVWAGLGAVSIDRTGVGGVPGGEEKPAPEAVGAIVSG